MQIPKLYEKVNYEDVSIIIKNAMIAQFKNGVGLYLWGKTGVGKTHIAYAIAKHLDEKKINVCFKKIGFLMEELRKFEDDYLLEDIYKSRGVLFLDDVGSEKCSEWVREKLYLILDYRSEHMLPVVITSNCDMDMLAEKVGSRISSRIAGMTKEFEIQAEDKRIK